LGAEEKVLGITHAEVGYLLADHWLLPTALANAIRYHHLPELEPEPRGPASVVFLADTFCKMDASEFEETKVFDDNVLEALKVLNMSEGALRKTLDVYRDIASDITVF
jgi:HD-like signal output (HDOD) protein